MASVAAPSFVKPEIPSSYVTEFWQMCKRVRNPLGAPLRLYASINGQAHLLGGDNKLRFKSFLKTIQGKTIPTDANAFYVYLKVQLNTDGIPGMIKLIEWALTKLAFWRSPILMTNHIVLPSTLLHVKEGQTVEYLHYNRHHQITLRKEQGKQDHEKALEQLETELRRLPSHVNPYLFYEDAPADVLVIGDRRFTPETRIYRPGSAMWLEKRDCDTLQNPLSWTIPYMEQPAFNNLRGTLKISFGIPRNEISQSGIVAIQEGQFLFVFGKTMRSVQWIKWDLKEKFPDFDPLKYQLELQCIDTSSHINGYSQPYLKVYLNFIPKL